MIGLCKHCGDPAADLKLNKVTRQVVCSATGCFGVKDDVTPFMVKMLESNNDFLQTNSEEPNNSLSCGECKVSTSSVLKKRALKEGVRLQDAEVQEKYRVLCGVCGAEKSVNNFMLNALVETLHVTPDQPDRS
jgi:hypothetical protein